MMSLLLAERTFRSEFTTNGASWNRQGAKFLITFPAGTDFAHLDRSEFGRRAFARIADRVLARTVEQEEAADDLFRFREGSVDKAAVAVSHRDADTLRCWGERVVGFQDPACLEALAERDHPIVKHLPVRYRPRLTLPDGLYHQQHVWHCYFLQTVPATSTIQPTPSVSATYQIFATNTSSSA